MGKIGDVVCVRAAPPGGVDLGVLAALVNAAFLTHDLMEGERTSAEGMREELGASGDVLLAELEGELLGCAIIRPGSDYAAEQGGYPWAESALYFGLAGVRVEHMRAGIGRALVREAELIAVERGFAAVGLSTLREFSLVEYYGAFGYEMVAYEDYERGHWGLLAPHRLCYMQKVLG
ncbi:MAG: GNAT family N-acetyltransferase [Tepidiformaceae bacterium]